MPNEHLRRLRSPERQREIRATRDHHGKFEWRELRAHLETMLGRLGVVLQDLKKRGPDDEAATAERLLVWCQREARFAAEELQHLPSVADWQGGVCDDPGTELDFPQELLPELAQIVADRFDADPAVLPTFSDEELDALTALLSGHLTLSSNARECLVLVVPEQDVAFGPHERVARVSAGAPAAYGYVFGVLQDATIRARVSARFGDRPHVGADGVDEHAGQRQWPVDSVVEVARQAVTHHGLVGAFGLTWFSDISERTAPAHAVRVMEQLAGLIALADAARPPRGAAWVIAVEVETALGGVSKHLQPLIVGAHRVDCRLPGDLSPLWFNPWWMEVGRRFCTELHMYAADAREVAGRFRRALHFWSRGEAAFGASPYDAADRFLNYLTAIEVVLAPDRQAVTASVASRAAGVVQGSAQGRLESANHVRDLYRVRSSYVHEGLAHVSRANLEAAREFARLVLRDLASWSAQHDLERSHADYIQYCDLRAVGG